MKRRLPVSVPAVLVLLVGLAGGLAGGASGALANTVVIPIAGSVDGPPEAVSLSGSVELTSKLVPIEVAGTPRDVILSVRLVNVTGQGTSGTSYVAPGEKVLIRPLGSLDFLDLTFAFYPSGSGGQLRARPARATFSLAFDTATGDIVAATTGGFTNP